MLVARDARFCQWGGGGGGGVWTGSITDLPRAPRSVNRSAGGFCGVDE